MLSKENRLLTQSSRASNQEDRLIFTRFSNCNQIQCLAKSFLRLMRTKTIYVQHIELERRFYHSHTFPAASFIEKLRKISNQCRMRAKQISFGVSLQTISLIHRSLKRKSCYTITSSFEIYSFYVQHLMTASIEKSFSKIFIFFFALSKMSALSSAHTGKGVNFNTVFLPFYKSYI